MNMPQYEMLGNKPGYIKYETSCNILVFLSTTFCSFSENIYTYNTSVILTIKHVYKSTRISATN